MYIANKAVSRINDSVSVHLMKYGKDNCYFRIYTNNISSVHYFVPVQTSVFSIAKVVNVVDELGFFQRASEVILFSPSP